VRLEDAKPAAFGLGVQSGYGLAQAQGLSLIETEVLSYHGHPQGQNWRSVDGDGWRSHTSVLLPSTSGYSEGSVSHSHGRHS
jgi:hypothetical protein